MIRLGLTGSIGMGKSTTSDMFAEQGIPIYSADTQVHKLYESEPALSLIEAAFPDVIRQGRIERSLLSHYISRDTQALKKLEAIVHPLLQEHEQAFLHQARAAHHQLVVLDIPLLYETQAQNRVDYVVVVSAPAPIQRQRVLARTNMGQEKYQAILTRQLPDEEKRRRADFIINTACSLDETRMMVCSICNFFAKRTA